MELKKIELPQKEYLAQIGLEWYEDGTCIADEVVVICEDEARGYYDAANELYDMFVAAAQYVIDNNLFFELGIPFTLEDAIKKSWEEESCWHLYGRFDLAGGIDGEPIKLIEFNADTPTMLVETAIVQWAILRYNGLDEAKQFNRVYEAIVENFVRLGEKGGAKAPERILFSSIKGSVEDEITTRLLGVMAKEAGYKSRFCYVEEVEFGDDGIFLDGERYGYWFKLIPWESIAIEEPELALLLSNIIQNQKALIFNPPYTLLFQSKGILPILWRLFEGHPLLLEASFEPLLKKACVKKRTFGREGANIRVYDKEGKVVRESGGEYGGFAPVYQEYVELLRDEQKRSYQAGVFFAYEGCGLGYRRGDIIIDDGSEFVGHMIR
jgi:glutathionylspermidine synthase